ncbi:RagB/SusD family nutrient uptake outer membrane protein [Pedobacter montanisoli]|uniref:RagB/SusD family nutrient uptake outer membrane protein n=1 Tax=Pedobacter montanisoli TaxID=2923277 RepID=A0ABS9ZWB1_9SPHI|nr:RagB/SusD family nutrient uptake outer membrane protein [Pedobacter montanisoli]MCJ0742591.1 RagB/SusD family nutrient uptake outer membrane protein [Pedobacter montanisoli]
MIKRSTIYRFNFRAVLIVGIGMMLFTSCKKNEKLNPKATTLITDVDAFSSPERIEAQVNGLYVRLKSGSFLGSFYFIATDIRSGDFISTNLNAAVGATTYQLQTQTTTNDVKDIWEAGYQAINAANVFIDGMTTFNGTTVVGDAKSKNYIAEARLIRAISYYYLLQLYAQPFWNGAGSKPGLPLRLKGITGGGNFDLARSSVKKTYEQILDDLNFAEQNLPLKYSTADFNTTRAHRNTAIALKTKVYLSMQDYPMVKTEADKIVSLAAPFKATSGVENTLNASIQAVFGGSYNTTESILSMPFTTNDRPGTALGNYYLPGKTDGGSATSNGSANYSLNPNGIPADLTWTTADDRRKFLVKGPITGKLWLTKFSQATPYLDYAPVIRYSEVMLNLAEAIARTTTTVDARGVALLNAVRNRSDKTTTYTVASFANNDEFLAAILKERQIEFLGEGIRNSDIMRLGLDIPAKPAHSVPAAAPSAPNYIYPISIDELILNKLMTDNK